MDNIDQGNNRQRLPSCIQMNYAITLLLFLFQIGSSLTAQNTSKEISTEERILGLAQVYGEAKYNFLYWDQIPDLDWDRAFLELLPQVVATTDKVAYVKLLKRFVARLKDGHTFFLGPREVFNLYDSPPVTVMEVSGRPVIVDCSAPDDMGGIQIEKYAEILSVDGIPVETYLKDSVYPYISAGTEHYLKYAGCIELLRGRKNSLVELEIEESNGQRRKVSLKRNLIDLPLQKQPMVFMELPTFPWKLKTIMHRELGEGLHYVAINTMADSNLPELFDKLLDSISPIKGLIIDVRLNHGGNSANGDRVIERLINERIPNIKSKTAAYRPSERAWKKETFGKNWHEYDMTYLEPRGEFQFNGPVVVLTSPYTWSAAENFVVPLAAAKRIKLVGQPTGGSTGQPLFIRLVGGMAMGICSVRREFPNGTEFVGYGVPPDVYIEPNLNELRDGRDNMLLKGIEVLKSMIH